MHSVACGTRSLHPVGAVAARRLAPGGERRQRRVDQQRPVHRRRALVQRPPPRGELRVGPLRAAPSGHAGAVEDRQPARVTTPDIATARLVRTRAGAAHLLHRLADRVEVRLTGTCLGAGIELPAFAGLVVATPGTTVQLPEIRMGFIPGAGGTASIPRRIGRWRTLHLALTGTALDARTALEWGLVDRVESSSVAVQLR